MLKNHALLKLAIEALENGHPDRAAVNGDINGDISPTRASIELGVARGYSMFGARLRQLAVPIVSGEGLPESEYRADDSVRKPKPKKK